MAESKLRTISIDFAVQILYLVKFLKSQHETIVSNQIGRAGTSIGANIHEAQYAYGKPDFIAKLQIALKEANETSYWLELLLKTNYISGLGNLTGARPTACGKRRPLPCRKNSATSIMWMMMPLPEQKSSMENLSSVK